MPLIRSPNPSRHRCQVALLFVAAWALLGVPPATAVEIAVQGTVVLENGMDNVEVGDSFEIEFTYEPGADQDASPTVGLYQDALAAAVGSATPAGNVYVCQGLDHLVEDNHPSLGDRLEWAFARCGSNQGPLTELKIALADTRGGAFSGDDPPMGLQLGDFNVAQVQVAGCFSLGVCSAVAPHYSFTVSLSALTVPEPTTAALYLALCGTLAALRRR